MFRSRVNVLAAHCLLRKTRRIGAESHLRDLLQDEGNKTQEKRKQKKGKKNEQATASPLSVQYFARSLLAWDYIGSCILQYTDSLATAANIRIQAGLWTGRLLKSVAIGLRCWARGLPAPFPKWRCASYVYWKYRASNCTFLMSERFRCPRYFSFHCVYLIVDVAILLNGNSCTVY